MATLLRLQGDSNDSSTEIRNNFRQPVIIPKNAKVGLKFAELQMLEDEVDFYDIEPDMFITRKQGTGNVNVNTSVEDIYLLSEKYTNINDLYQMIEGRLNGTPIGNGYSSYYVNSDTNSNNHTRIVGYSSGTRTAPDFNNTSYWTYSWMNPSTDTNSLTAPGDILTSTVSSKRISGSTRNEFDFELTTLGAFNIYIMGLKNEDTPLVEVEMDSVGNISINGNSCGTRATSADRIFIEHNTINIIAYITINATVSNYIFPVNYHPGRDQFSVGHTRMEIKFPAGSTCKLSDFEGVFFTNQHSNNVSFTNLNDPMVPSELTITFSNKILASYLGFHDLEYNSNVIPSIITAEGTPNPERQLTGVMVVVEGLGQLESYDGSKSNKGGASIVDVIALDSFYKASYYNPNIVPLAINNERELNLSQLRVRFLNSSNGNNLSFKGLPSIVLVIYP